jgi:hypothetical protein
VSLAETLVGLAVSLALLVLAAIASRRPKTYGKVRLVPWTAIMFVALLSAILLIRHAAGLLGAPA